MKKYLLSLLCTALLGTAWGQNTCLKTKTVCVPEPTTVVKTKILFSSDCATKCHKACPLFRKGGDCNSCKDGSCGHAHVERYLYKRVQKEVCDSFKCVPTQAPVCTIPTCAPKCAAPCGPACANGTCLGANVTMARQVSPAAPVTTGSNTPSVEVLMISCPVAPAPRP